MREDGEGGDCFARARVKHVLLSGGLQSPGVPGETRKDGEGDFQKDNDGNSSRDETKLKYSDQKGHPGF